MFTRGINRCLLLITAFCMTSTILHAEIDKEEKYIVESNYSITDTLFVSDIYMQAITAETFESDSVKAYGCFSKILEVDPRHAPTLYKMAMYSGAPKEGLKYIERALAIDSTNTTYLGVKLELQRKAGDYEDAIKTCDALISLDPNDTYPHINKSLLLTAVNKPYDAIAVIEDAIDEFGERIELLHYLQTIYQRLQLFDKALEVGDKLLEIYPDNMPFILTQAEINIARRNNSEAERLYAEAKAINPKDMDYQIAINEYYKQFGTTLQFLTSLTDLFANSEMELDKKIDYFANNIRKPEYYQNYYSNVDALVGAVRSAHPAEWEATKLYAFHLVNSGKNEEAMEVYRKQSEIESADQLTAYKYLIGLAAHLESDSLMQICMEANNKFPNDIELKLQVASIMAENDHFDQAVKMVKWCVKRADSSDEQSEILGYLGDLYHQAGDMRSTYRYYDKALKLDPSNVTVLNNYSYYLSQEGRDLDKALSMSALVKESEPDNPTYLDTYGWILHKLGKHEQAKSIILRAIALDVTGSSELLLHMGDICMAMGDKISAEIYWDRALKAGAEEADINKRKVSLK